MLVTGPNATSATTQTDANGAFTFSYIGNNAGTDTIQAILTASGLNVRSNAVSLDWIAPTTTVSTSTVHGNFFAENSSAQTFVATPSDTPAFGQEFPTVNFDPPAGTIPNNPPANAPANYPSINDTTRPFADVTTDLSGNFMGGITAQGNGLEAGVGTLTSFDAELEAHFIVPKAGDVSFNVVADDGFILGVGNGATRVSGTYVGFPQPGQTPFQSYPAVAAFDQAGGSSPQTFPVTIHFPAPGTYPYELDYFECCGSDLSLTMTVASFTQQTSPLSIYVGYADGIRPAGSIFPFPWDGSANVNFIGCCAAYDAGAIRFDNSSSGAIVLDSVTVDIGGNHFDLWPHALTIPGGQILILTSTGNYNFDTSDFSNAGCGGNDGVTPQVNVTIAGATTTYLDSNQILNTFGYDLACRGNESQSWQRIGGGGTPINTPLPPTVTLGLAPTVATDIVGQSQAITVSAMDSSGRPVPNLPVDVVVAGANGGSGVGGGLHLAGTTNATGAATVTYTGGNAGTDTVSATAFIGGLRSVSNQATLTWSIPIPGGGGSGGTPAQAPPAITNISPADGTVVSKPTPISATFTPPTGETIASWSVSYVALQMGSPVALSSGTGSPPNPLGTLDPTRLPNDTYAIAISATASGGGTQTSTTSLVVHGNLKLGRYVTTYQDLSVAVSGFQMQVLRTYDSTDKRVGDFGVGWHVSLSNFRTSANRMLGADGWTEYPISCVFGLCTWGFATSGPHYVTVTWPDGHQEIFNFTPSGGQALLYFQGSAAYTAVPGTNTTSALAPIAVDQSVNYAFDGNLYNGSGGVYNPTQFKLTTRDGRVLILDTSLGLVSETDPSGNSLTVGSTGVHSYIGPASGPTPGPSISFTRDPQGRITDINGPDAAQHIHYTYYSGVDELQSVTDPNANTDTYTYDPVTGNLEKSLDPTNQPIQTLTYDPTSGRLVSIANGSSPPTTISTIIGALQQVIADPNGKLTTVQTFDSIGDLIEQDRIYNGRTVKTTAQFDSAGRPTLITDALGHSEQFVYDESVSSSNGNLLSFTEGGRTWSFTNYDGFGQVGGILAPDGSTVVTYKYDTKTGSLLSAQQPGLPPETFTYYPNGLVDVTMYPDGRTEADSYNASGYLTATADSSARSVVYVPDAAGNVLSTTDQAGTTTHYQYDGLGNITTITDGLGLIYGFTYNALNLLTAASDPAGTTSYIYDSTGHLMQRTDRNGVITSYTYDNDGRLAQELRPNNDVTTYRYDPIGRLTEADNLGSELNFSYDDADNLVDEALCAPQVGGATCTPSGPPSSLPTVSLAYTYFADNQTASVTGKDGLTAYGYDPNGRLNAVTDAAGRQFHISFDADGRLQSIQMPNGVTENAAFDAAGNVSSIVSSAHASPIASDIYTIDPSTDLRSSVTTLSGLSSLTYLKNGWLQSASQPPASGLSNEAYTYDGAGNRTSWSGAPASSVSYDSLERLKSDGVYTYTYDAEGNLVTKVALATAAKTVFHWNADHQLTAIDYPDGTHSSYTYDPLGRRVQIDDSGVVRTDLWDGFNLHAEFDANGQLATAFTLTPTNLDGTGAKSPAEVLESVTQGAVSYYSQDAQGSTVATTNATGAVSGSYQYDSSGKPGASNGPLNTYTYAGAQWDPRSGLYYMGDRYYDPSTGRFLSQDPAAALFVVPTIGRWTRSLSAQAPGNPISLNRYTYALDDPANFTDPSGDSPFDRLLVTAACVLIGFSPAAGSNALDVCTSIASNLAEIIRIEKFRGDEATIRFFENIGAYENASEEAKAALEAADATEQIAEDLEG